MAGGWARANWLPGRGGIHEPRALRQRAPNERLARYIVSKRSAYASRVSRMERLTHKSKGATMTGGLER